MNIGLQCMRIMLGLGWVPTLTDGYRDGYRKTHICKWNMRGVLVSPVRLGHYWHHVTNTSNAPFYGKLDRICHMYGRAFADEELVGPVVRPRSSSPTRKGR